MVPAGRVTLAAIMLVASLGGTMVHARHEMQRATLENALPRQFRLPPALQRLVRHPAGHKPATASQVAGLRQVIARAPIDQKLANLYYVALSDSGASSAVVATQARLTAALGWRNTPAQQNLLIRDALAQHYAAVVDRADGLLRRQQLTPFAFTFLATVESLPQVRPLVAAKLRGGPPWRSDFLAASGGDTRTQAMDARVGTISDLLRAPGGVDRREIAPLLGALMQTGRGGEAYALWTRFARRRSSSDVIADGTFQDAGVRAAQGDIVIPFEWQFGSDIGYSAQPTGDGQGMAITWDGRGVPTLAAQAVPVAPGARYVLALRGRADGARLNDVVAPALYCGARRIAFTSVGTAGTAVSFLSDIVPDDCDIAGFALDGRLLDTARSVNARIERVSMQRAG